MASKRGRGPSAEDEALAKRREMSMTIRAEVAARIEANDPRVLLDELCERWELSATGTSLEAFTRLAFDQLGGGPGYGDSDIDLHKDNEYGLRQLDETIEKHEQEAITVFNKIKQLDPAGDEPDLQRRASKVLEMIYYAKRIVLSAFQARLGVHELNSSDFRLAEDLDILLGSWTLRFRWIDQTKSTPLQKVLLHLLDMAMEKRYRKFDGMVYEPIVVNGHETHAWRTVCDIKQFVFASTRKELYFEQWSNLTSAGSKSVVEHLTHCEDYQFQFLKKDRTVFSFRNGLYLASEDRFHAYGSGGLSDTVVAAKFFDFEFEEHQGADWWDIPTPHMDVIMNFQEWSKEVQRWMYVVLGRLLYPVGDRDGWQIVPFMHGRASAGKCHCRGTLILMRDGKTKPVEDIVVGDEVMGDDSQPRRVLSLAQGMDDMFTLVPKRKGYPSQTVTREHVLCLKYSNQGSAYSTKYGKGVSFFDGDHQKTKARKFTHRDQDKMTAFQEALDRDQTFEMTVEKYMQLPKYVQGYLKAYRVAAEFPPKPAPLFDPWLLGVWLGDGTSATTGLTIGDIELVDAIKTSLEPFADLKVVGGAEHYNESCKWRYNIIRASGSGTNQFLSALREYDMLNNKHVPFHLKTGSRHTRLELLAGLLDTDGHLGNGSYYEISQKNRTLADDIVFVARSLGFSTSMSPCQKWCMYKGERRRGTYYRINILGNGIEDIPLRLKRKQVPTKTRATNALWYGFTVQPAGRQEYFGFETDGNHRFLLGDFTVTHNSTIALKVAKLFYEPGDIGIVSNNMEKQFGISAFSDKLLVIGPEIGQGWRMEQLEFQSMASGESVSVAAKFKTAQSVEWTVPILLAGNEVPPFADNGGSIQRRFLVFGFEKAVTNGDMKLGDKLAKELPALLLKCNRAYLEAAARWGTKNVWTVLPTYFHNTRAEMAQAVNSIEAFLACNEVVLEATAFTRYREFVDAWRAFTTVNRYPGAKTVTKRLFDTPFEKLGLTIVKDTREYNGRQESDEWVLGVKLKEQSSGNGYLAG